jgi:hypothetical protein
MPIPDQFCWTRFGTEAAQPIEAIFARKEEERRANGGLFFWGIGNAVGPSMRELIRRSGSPEVLFSPIKSAARHEDSAPPAVVAWTSGETLTGEHYQLPATSLVTSRFDPDRPRGAHYALVCFSDRPLHLASSDDQIVYSELRNILTGRPVGASQVTSIIQRESHSGEGSRTYGVAVRARLVAPFLIRLGDPVMLNIAPDGSTERPPNWAEAVKLLWDRRVSMHQQLSLQGI